MNFKPDSLYSIALILLFQCSSSSANKEQSNNKVQTKETTFSAIKINGVSFVSPSKEINPEEINYPNEIVAANYLSFMPYGFVAEGSTDLVFDSEWQWWGEKSEGITRMSELAKIEGYKIMLKPHVWKRHGEFTGDHSHDNIEDWQAFEKTYEKYILHYAKLAESHQIALFCIGTEWEKFVLERSEFWFELINKVRKVYSGKISYAANWDEYLKVPFWEKLDYIGVDAYFPLVKDEVASVKALESALNPFKNQLEKLADSLQMQILFTEYGYRSRVNSAEKPWEADRNGKVNLQAQINGYTAFYNTFWKKSFIAGGFLWKWFPNHKEVGGSENNGFTPQNKPVEKLIKKNSL